MTPHWAAYLIGKPYKEDAIGPDEFNCLGFVQYVFKQHKGIDLPVTNINLHESGNESIIREAARRGGFRPVLDDSYEEDDIMLMENAEGPHIGMLIRTSGKLRLLHCVMDVGVCHFPLADLGMLGYRNMRSWRLQ